MSEDAEIKTLGTLYGFIFEEKNLTDAILKVKLQEVKEPVYISNLKEAKFVLQDKEISFSDVKNINFNLTGNLNVVYKIDENIILSALINQPKKEFKNILARFPNINSGDLVIKPVWQTKIPKEKKSINIKINYP